MSYFFDIKNGSYFYDTKHINMIKSEVFTPELQSLARFARVLSAAMISNWPLQWQWLFSD